MLAKFLFSSWGYIIPTVCVCCPASRNVTCVGGEDDTLGSTSLPLVMLLIFPRGDGTETYEPSERDPTCLWEELQEPRDVTFTSGMAAHPLLAESTHCRVTRRVACSVSAGWQSHRVLNRRKKECVGAAHGEKAYWKQCQCKPCFFFFFFFLWIWISFICQVCTEKMTFDWKNRN